MGLEEDLRSIVDGRFVIVGVGNEAKGDDAVGVVVIRNLQRLGVPAIDCGDIPEGYTDLIKARHPETVLFVDAVDLGAEPGSVALISADQLADVKHDTHRPSLRLVMRYLEAETGGRCYVLGVQPSRIGSRRQMSPEVEKAAVEITRVLRGILSD